MAPWVKRVFIHILPRLLVMRRPQYKFETNRLVCKMYLRSTHIPVLNRAELDIYYIFFLRYNNSKQSEILLRENFIVTIILYLARSLLRIRISTMVASPSSRPTLFQNVAPALKFLVRFSVFVGILPAEC